jgi:hypothetical protein
MGAEIGVHDPSEALVGLEKQDTYPAPGASWARFFRNQEGLTELRIEPDLGAALKGADAVVLAVRHELYRNLTPDEVIAMTGRPVAVIDCFGLLDDPAIRRYFELGCEVKVLLWGQVFKISVFQLSWGQVCGPSGSMWCQVFKLASRSNADFKAVIPPCDPKP